jgi:hypothetical protein
LSENAEFAKKVEQAGLIVGVTPQLDFAQLGSLTCENSSSARRLRSFKRLATRSLLVNLPSRPVFQLSQVPRAQLRSSRRSSHSPTSTASQSSSRPRMVAVVVVCVLCATRTL